ncbi:MAG TPA: ABC transporter ATP-binding protein [Alloacidobacterium sp.]|nr:ABC transporter ATP-binding protein [Alloacidobacterium sp.]
MSAALEFQNLSKHFGSYKALDNLSLVLEPGEILGFLGPNGAGKTTAIHLALGFLRPSSGGGTILGKPFGDTSSHAQVGFLPDSPSFFAGSARDAVEMAGLLNNMRNPHLQDRTRSLLAQFDLVSVGKDARRFSRGMQQRLGFAQALVNEPRLLILDEPTSALDPPGVLEVRELLRAVRNEGTSIFFSSHQLAEVEQICDRIAFLDHGKLLKQGPLQSFLEDSGHAKIVVRGLPSASIEALAEYRQYLDVSSAGSLQFVVPIHLQRKLIEHVWLAGGTLESVTPVRRTLEELFVDWSGKGEA